MKGGLDLSRPPFIFVVGRCCRAAIYFSSSRRKEALNSFANRISLSCKSLTFMFHRPLFLRYFVVQKFVSI